MPSPISLTVYFLCIGFQDFPYQQAHSASPCARFGGKCPSLLEANTKTQYQNLYQISTIPTPDPGTKALNMQTCAHIVTAYPYYPDVPMLVEVIASETPGEQSAAEILDVQSLPAI